MGHDADTKGGHEGERLAAKTSGLVLRGGPRTAFVALLAAGMAGALMHCSATSDPAAGAATGAPGNAADAGTQGNVADATAIPGDALPAPSSPAQATDAGDVPSATPVIDAGAPCSSAAQCGASPTAVCCAGACVDTAHDPRNCGTCGNGCTASQFCNGVACNQVAVSAACLNPKATVSLDLYAGDNAAGVAMGEALHEACVPQVTPRSLDQSSPILLDQVSSQPRLGPGDTFVAGGGQYGQKGLAWFDKLGLSPIYPAFQAGPGGADHLQFIQRANGSVLVNPLMTALTDHHDYFTVYVAVDPYSGTLAFTAFGLMLPGTTAASWHFVHKMAANLGTYTKGWYLYEWTDTDGNSAPSAGDTWTLLQSAP